jgi:tetratricopeptide (TPR) repeat protein
MMMRVPTGRLAAAALAVLGATAVPPAKAPLTLTVAAQATSITLVPKDAEPAEGRLDPGSVRLAELSKAVSANPADRQLRLELVQALVAARRPAEALEAAKEWRSHDAYNLVVVRTLGDLYAQLGDTAKARRTYSAVAELLASDVSAQRALASVLKQSGDLESAYARLQVCRRLEPNDQRTAFELADTAQRLGRTEEAAAQLAALVADAATPLALRYPAKQRLAQIWGGERRRALAAGDTAHAREISEAIDDLEVKGGIENDIKVYLTWDTDQSDVDLWVTTPSGERVYYGAKLASHGEALFDDVTTGYGPESFTAKSAAKGTYKVQVNYYRPRTGAFAEARGEVTVILGEGRERESRHVLPYRLFQRGQTVTVAEIEVR